MSTRVVDILVLMVKHALRHKTISAKTLINWNRYAWPTIQICEYSINEGYLNFLIDSWCITYCARTLLNGH